MLEREQIIDMAKGHYTQRSFTPEATDEDFCESVDVVLDRLKKEHSTHPLVTLRNIDWEYRAALNTLNPETLTHHFVILSVIRAISDILKEGHAIININEHTACSGHRQETHRSCVRRPSCRGRDAA